MKDTGRMIALALGFLALGSCKKIADQLASSSGTQSGSTAAAAQGASPEQDKDEALGTKLEGYIDCLNRTSSDVSRTRNMYLRDVDEAKGPTGKESSIYVPKLDPDYCFKGLDKSRAAQPAIADLDAAAAAYRAAAAELTPLVNAASQYYEHKDFKDDKFAKGKSMHAPLVAALNKFSAANKEFDAKVTTLNDALSQRRLARLKADPSAKFQYLVAETVDEAKKLVKFADVEKLTALNEAAYNTALAAYEKAYNDATQYQSAHKDEADKVLMLSRFTSTADDYLKSAKELMRRKRDNKDFAKEFGSPEMVEGHPAQVLAKFNDLIEASNSLQFRQ